jgi:tetratricopeptide (TPR) repeat protein
VTASTFGHPKLGADAADRAIRLDPNYGFGTASRIRNVYFLAERYEDALRMVERQPPESRTMGGLMQRAASYAALGRSEEARAAVAAALERHPDLSIQGLLSRPEIGDAERKQTEPLMREAGFPASRKRWRKKPTWYWRQSKRIAGSIAWAPQAIISTTSVVSLILG